MSSILTAEDFCAWLGGYLSGVTGRDELDAFEANTIRNTLNAIGATVPHCEVQSGDAATVPYVAWIAFAENGNIRFWTGDYNRAIEERRRGLDLRAFTLAELVALAARAPAQARPMSELEGEAWDRGFSHGRSLIKDYIDRAIASFAFDTANSQFQKGYLSALEIVSDEAFAMPSAQLNSEAK